MREKQRQRENNEMMPRTFPINLNFDSNVGIWNLKLNSSKKLSGNTKIYESLLKICLKIYKRNFDQIFCQGFEIFNQEGVGHRGLILSKWRINWVLMISIIVMCELTLHNSKFPRIKNTNYPWGSSFSCVVFQL